MELDKNLIEKVAAYQPPAKMIRQIARTPILVVVGISGAGKDTVQNRLTELHPDEYKFIISHTTRKPRQNHGVTEQDGVEYHFIDFATADRMLDRGEFVEAKVVHFDNIYGTSITEIEAAKATQKIAVTDIEVKGVREYVNLGMNVKPVFLLPPSYEVWWERLLRRYEGKVHQHDLVKRMKTALTELEHAISTDYFYIVINDDLDKTVELVNQIAHGADVEPRYRKAMEVAEHIIRTLRAKLSELE